VKSWNVKVKFLGNPFFSVVQNVPVTRQNMSKKSLFKMVLPRAGKSFFQPVLTDIHQVKLLLFVPDSFISSEAFHRHIRQCMPKEIMRSYWRQTNLGLIL